MLCMCGSSFCRLCSFAEVAMHLFNASAASSSALRADQPASSSSGRAEQSATSLRSAEQPDLKIASIRDVQRWLAAEHVASCSNIDGKAY